MNLKTLHIILHYLQLTEISSVPFLWHSTNKCKLVRSYITNIKQNVEIKSCNTTQNFFSEWGTLKYGVIQGSILETLLFTI